MILKVEGLQSCKYDVAHLSSCDVHVHVLLYKISWPDLVQFVSYMSWIKGGKDEDEECKNVHSLITS